MLPFAGNVTELIGVTCFAQDDKVFGDRYKASLEAEEPALVFWNIGSVAINVESSEESSLFVGIEPFRRRAGESSSFDVDIVVRMGVPKFVRLFDFGD